jgi:hypothetical protein
MFSRLLILSLLIPSCVAPVAAQSSPNNEPFSYPSSQNGLTPPFDSRLRLPSLLQNGHANPKLLQRKLSTLAQNAAPCYTIRSYRFTRDNPNSDTTTFANYSTCQPSTQFHVKDAVNTPSK